MRSTRVMKFVSYTVPAFAVAFLLAACGHDAPLAPAHDAVMQAPATALVPNEVTVEGLLRTKPLTADIVASAVIGPNGGKIEIYSAGFALIVPKYAVLKNTTFTVKALKGSLVAYEFGPHGSRFLLPLEFKQNLALVDPRRIPSLFVPVIGYFANTSDLDQVNGRAKVTELLPGFVVTEVTGKLVKGYITHFSGYMVSSGRR
jgi:hypothetical protein